MDSLGIETTPSELDTKVMQPVSIVTTVTNSSEVNLVVLDARRNLPVGISERVWNQNTPYALHSHEQLSFRSELESENVGNFVVSEFRLTIGSRRTLFLDHVTLHDRFRVLVGPIAVRVANPIDITSLTDLIHDETRRGIGTDFAGLRPATYLDGSRVLDWKVVARFGELYAREFYLDQEPSTMLMVDTSLIKGLSGSVMLEQLYQLIANIQVASALGLLLYGPESVITMIPPSRGPKQKEKIIGALLQSYDIRETQTYSIPPQPAFSDEIRSISSLTAYEKASKPNLRRLSLFARTVLPFYSYAESKRAEQLRRQGSYLGFKAITDLAERTLVITIADGRSNVEGLVEGARLAVRSNLEVALVLLSVDAARFRDVLGVAARLRRVMVARSTPRNLVRVVNTEIADLSHKRGH